MEVIVVYILQDKKDNRMFYKGTNNAYGRHAYTYVEDNALVFENYDEACMVAEDIKSNVIEIKVKKQKKKQTKSKKKEQVKTKENKNGQFGFDI